MLFETKITYIFKSEEKPQFPIHFPAFNSLKVNKGMDVVVPEDEETRGSSAKETSHNDGNIEGSDAARGGKEEGKDEGQNNNQDQGKKLRPPAESNSNNESEDSVSSDSNSIKRNEDEESQRGSDSNDSDHGSDGSNDLGVNAKRYLAGGQSSGDNSRGGNNNRFGSSSSQNNDAGSGDDTEEVEWDFEDGEGGFDNYL